jgi:hypothetical protein
LLVASSGVHSHVVNLEVEVLCQQPF